MDFSRTAHRPFPMPEGAHAVRMVWHDLLFMHWPVDATELAPLIPPGLAIDTHEGSAWLGIVPFRMTGVSHRLLPDLPGVSAFPELNVRTYVRDGDAGGVLFLSLDATSALAVRIARWTYRLPYHLATIAFEDHDGWIDYTSRRQGGTGPSAEFRARYCPAGTPAPARPGSVEQFLIERYCLFAEGRKGTILRADIHHEPWAIQPAACEVRVNTMVSALGLTLPPEPPLLHYARRMDAVAWPIGASHRQRKSRPAGVLANAGGSCRSRLRCTTASVA